MTYIAVSGWLLFAIAVWLYRKRSVAATDDAATLSLFSLAILLSDAYRSPIREGIEEAMRQAPPSREAKSLASSVMCGLVEMARDHMKGKDGVPHPYVVVVQHIEKLRTSSSHV